MWTTCRLKMTHLKIMLFPFTFVVCLILNAQLNDGLKILGLFPLNVKSHFVMCEELMRGLAEKGHRVDVYSHFPLKSPIKNYHDYSLAGLLPPILDNITFRSVLLMQNHEASLKLWFEKQQEPLCDLIGCSHFQKLLRDPPQNLAYDLIVTELSIVNCYIPFGQKLNAPVVGVVTTSLYDYQYPGFGTTKYLAVHSSMFSPRFSAYTRPMSFFGRLNNLLNYQRALREYQKWSRPQEKYVEKYFGPGFPKAIDLLKQVSLVLVNRDTTIQGVETLAPKIISVAGLHVVDRNETLPKVVQKWLDDSVQGCVYFSFGSMIKIETFSAGILHALYNSFENIKPVRVLFRIVDPEDLPAGLPSNVLTQPWFNQVAVLKHKNVKAFVTHAGLMGSQEAVYYGVPMVVVPLVSDEFFNAMQFVVDKVAIGFHLGNITERSFTNALNEILNNPLYRTSMQRKSQLFRDRPLPPLETAIYWIEYIHRNGKDALKSPLKDLMWWQASLLDVYAFIVASILLILYIFAKVVHLLKSSCRKCRDVDVDSSSKKKN